MPSIANTIIASVVVASATATKCHKPYYGGELDSIEEFTYGKFEARVLPNEHLGIVSSLFTFWRGGDTNPGVWNEIDIEIPPTQTQTGYNRNLIVGDGDRGRIFYENQIFVGNFSEWHTVGFEWKPHVINYLVDGEIAESITADKNPEVDLLHLPSALMMNFWAPGEVHRWSKGLDDSLMPFETRYDWVRTYDYDQENDEFILRWQEDFDTFNSTRWTVANNHTFEVNKCYFMEQNVKIEYG
jgi:beta-glucanase (GH16 family)